MKYTARTKRYPVLLIPPLFKGHTSCSGPVAASVPLGSALVYNDNHLPPQIFNPRLCGYHGSCALVGRGERLSRKTAVVTLQQQDYVAQAHKK